MSETIRCAWASHHLAIEYHDKEWGVPLHDDRRFFEFLVLDTFQAGLSWLTILKKRENFRNALDNFDHRKIAAYGEEKVSELLNDPGIIRNRLKVNATISNARAFIGIQEEFGSFDAYVWDFVGGEPIQNRRKSLDDLPVTTPDSDRLSKDLYRRGFKFVGSTTTYAFMQAAGLVNDHEISCFRYKEVQV